MKVAFNIKTMSNAIMKPMGNGYFVTIGKINKFFDREETATSYIVNLGYTF